MNGQLFINEDKGHRRFTLERICHESHSHQHNQDHIIQVVEGRIFVRVWGSGVLHQKRYLRKGQELLVPAEAMHVVKAMSPGATWDCVFPHLDFDGQVTQRYVGNQSAYF